jgi:hypothetical protein
MLRRVCLFLALLNRAHDVPRLRDLGPVDLGLGIRLGFSRMAGMAATAALEMRTHTLSLVAFKGTGVGLLLRYADVQQNIEDRLALDFQLTC